MPNEPRTCACRCGAAVNRTFCPGHDSKLVAKLVHGYEEGRLSRAQALRVVKRISPALTRKLDLSLSNSVRAA
jgi:hypothetical protein